jgi:hypothetical protein
VSGHGVHPELGSQRRLAQIRLPEIFSNGFRQRQSRIIPHK